MGNHVRPQGVTFIFLILDKSIHRSSTLLCRLHLTAKMTSCQSLCKWFNACVVKNKHWFVVEWNLCSHFCLYLHQHCDKVHFRSDCDAEWSHISPIACDKTHFPTHTHSYLDLCRVLHTHTRLSRPLWNQNI